MEPLVEGGVVGGLHRRDGQLEGLHPGQEVLVGPQGRGVSGAPVAGAVLRYELQAVELGQALVPGAVQDPRNPRQVQEQVLWQVQE